MSQGFPAAAATSSGSGGSGSGLAAGDSSGSQTKTKKTDASNGKEKLETLQAQVQQVTNVMTENVEKILQRGSRLDDLSERTEVLTSRADEFRSTSRRVTRHMWWKNMRLNFLILLVIIIVVLILYFSLR